MTKHNLGLRVWLCFYIVFIVIVLHCIFLFVLLLPYGLPMVYNDDNNIDIMSRLLLRVWTWLELPGFEGV